MRRAGRDRPVCVQGQRRAVPGRRYTRSCRTGCSSPTATFITGRTGAPPRTPARAPVAGEIRPHAPAAGVLSGRLLPVRAGQPPVRGKARAALAEAARAGGNLDPRNARYVRVIEYEVPDREGDGKDEVIALITTIVDFPDAPAAVLAQAYHERWEHETGNAQLKTYLRGPGKILRSESPDMVKQEIWGYLLTHYAISALICTAATNAGIDPDRSSSRGRSASSAAGPLAPLFPLASASASLTASWPPSRTRSSSTNAASAATPVWSSAPATTTTRSRNPASTAPATMPASPLTRQPHPDQRKDQNRSMIENKLSGMAQRRRRSRKGPA